MTYAITAQTREALGRRAKHVMDTGAIPAVVYGNGVEARSIQIDASAFRKLYQAAGTSSLVDLTVDSGSPMKTLIKEVQVHPIAMTPIHVDFHQIRMDEKLTTEVPLVFTGESRAVKELGGTLSHAMTSIEVTCLPADLPHEIVVDISKLETFDDAITVRSLGLPESIEVNVDPEATIAVVERPMTEEELKKLEETATTDVGAIKTEAEEKRAEEEAKKAEEGAGEEKK